MVSLMWMYYNTIRIVLSNDFEHEPEFTAKSCPELYLFTLEISN